MDIQFRTRALEKIANDGKAAQKALGKRCSDLLRRRLDDLRAAGNLAEMRHLPGRCHELKGDRAGQFAIDLEYPRRLLFEAVDGTRQADGGLEWSSITIVEIIELVDYH